MSFAVIQMVSQDDIPANLAAARALLEQAARQGARLAVLPENFAALGRHDAQRLGEAEADGAGPILPWLANSARELGLWLVGGTLPLPPDEDRAGKVRAASLLFDDKGRRVARYDKLHLFDVDVADARGAYRESDTYGHGEGLVVAHTPVGRLGLTVCYDLRFAEVYTALRAAGAELISVPSAFTRVTGAAHWELLVRARAVESQCYLLAPAQGGQHPGPRETWGHSLIVDPWGSIMAEQVQGEGVLLGGRDAALQERIRAGMPVLQQRRFHVTLSAGPSTGSNSEAEKP